MSKEIAVKVENLTKTFHIPLEAHSGLKQKLINTLKGRKGYREFSPLKGVSFEIEKGDFFGIVGRNGSGKSTLLKTLAGIYSPDGGAVHVNGSLVPFIELGVGFNPELTGRENVFLNGALLGFSRSEMEAMYDDIVEFAELQDFMEERLKNYSSGMQVRLAFSIAIRADGDVLLLDEVLAVGDEAFQRKCFEYFNDLKKNRKTVILVTHDMASVKEYCTKAVLIDKGELIKQGPPEVVANTYTQLLSPPSDTGVIESEEENRWGSHSYKLNNVKISVSDKSKYLSPITIEAKVDCHKIIHNTLIFAYAIKDGSGRVICGDKSEGIDLSASLSAKKMSLMINTKNILNKGRYTVDLSIFDPIQKVYVDIWLDCASFEVFTEGSKGFPVVLPSSFKVSQTL